MPDVTRAGLLRAGHADVAHQPRGRAAGRRAGRAAAPGRASARRRGRRPAQRLRGRPLRRASGGRCDTTMDIVFGDGATAERALRRLNGVHATVRGDGRRTPDAARASGRTTYRALDPELLLWVQATLVVTSVAGVSGAGSARSTALEREDVLGGGARGRRRRMGIPLDRQPGRLAGPRGLLGADARARRPDPGHADRRGCWRRSIVRPPLPLAARPGSSTCWRCPAWRCCPTRLRDGLRHAVGPSRASTARSLDRGTAPLGAGRAVGLARDATGARGRPARARATGACRRRGCGRAGECVATIHRTTPEEPMPVPETDLSRRAVVTGLGAVTPIGNDHPTFWRNLVAGVSGAGPITPFDADRLRRAHRGRGQGLRPDRRHGPQDGPPDEPLHPPGHGRRQGGRRRIPGSTSATGARSGATASPSPSTPAVAARSRSSMAPRRCCAKGPGLVSPFAIPALSGSMAACQLSMEYGLTGPVITQVAACASSRHRLPGRPAHDPAGRGGRRPGRRLGGAAAAHRLRGPRQHGRAVQAQRRPRRTPRGPFDRDRDGFLFGEGAGVVVARERASTPSRAARPSTAEVIGAALTADAFHISAPGADRPRRDAWP